MTRSRSRFRRFVDNMRRNVLSYKYLKHNILMTALVVIMSLCVFAVVSFGENADPLADELYANEGVTIAKSQAVMMADGSIEVAIDAAVPTGSYVSAGDTARVASYASGSVIVTDDQITTEEVTTEEPSTEIMKGVTAAVLYDGVDVQTEQSWDSDVIATVNSGEEFDVVSQDESWIGVMLYDGSIGYISTEYVSVDAALQ